MYVYIRKLIGSHWKIYSALAWAEAQILEKTANAVCMANAFAMLSCSNIILGCCTHTGHHDPIHCLSLFFISFICIFDLKHSLWASEWVPVRPLATYYIHDFQMEFANDAGPLIWIWFAIVVIIAIYLQSNTNPYYMLNILIFQTLNRFHLGAHTHTRICALRMPLF